MRYNSILNDRENSYPELAPLFRTKHPFLEDPIPFVYCGEDEKGLSFRLSNSPHLDRLRLILAHDKKKINISQGLPRYINIGGYNPQDLPNPEIVRIATK